MCFLSAAVNLLKVLKLHPTSLSTFSNLSFSAGLFHFISFSRYLGLLFDPGLGLVTLQVVVLDSQSRVQTVFLLVHQVSELTPPGRMDRDTIRIKDVQQFNQLFYS